MTKHLLNLPILLAATFCLAACAVITAAVFYPDAGPAGPTKLLDPPLPAPDFAVTDQDGRTITQQDMLGQVWVCDFFLTRCTGVCPMLGQAMAHLATQLDADPALQDVRLISFSVDPEHDRPDILVDYRAKWLPVWAGGNDRQREAIDRYWRHAAADDQDAFWALVNRGFLLTVGPNTNPEDTSTPIAHSSKLVLIDGEGRIRGYYDGLIPEEMDTLVDDLRRMVAE